MHQRGEAVQCDVGGTLVDSGAALLRSWRAELLAPEAAGGDVTRCVVAEGCTGRVPRRRGRGRRVLALSATHELARLTAADAVVTDLTTPSRGTVPRTRGGL